ncbi:arylsulfatase [Armatimonas rosea]|uniref:Arylsulfatase n=1 Tax=Armatimonas rosea TaxID=685828 RepID=A0A7W9W567_ARMRO|nr:arylsulfatase [Armatimonas rosea]MBB6048600.1 arylsulfatase [Armatimonas rosea]
MKKPNIVLILTDDQGFGDLSCHGNPVLKTPHIDRLHDEGVRFTHFHVSPTCSPTRAALLTGKHEMRSGISHTIYERERLSLKATTLAQVLQGVGYATGIFGKWHLGDEDAYQPDKRGFDEVFIHGAGGIGQSYPGSCGDAPGNTYFDPAIWHNGRFEKTKGYCTDVFFAQATRWIEEKRAEKAPFFAYITPNAPHAPLQVRPEDEARYAGKVADKQAAKFFGMIANIDDNIGKLLERLKELGIERETLVVFMNDNGGTAGVKVFNAGMRASKNTVYQGGTRAASFWRWPGTLKPADCDRLTAHLDILPTLAELTGAKAPRELDGRSLVSLLKNPQAKWGDRMLFVHTGRWEPGQPPSKYGNAGVRFSHYNAVATKNPSACWQLFDLDTDPGETTDISAQNPALVQKVNAAYDSWWASVLPCLENEDAYKTAPKVNPFKARYEKQFGGSSK